jgi:hypothetical protein
MTIRIDPVQAAGFRLQLVQYRKDLFHNKSLPKSIVLHIAGKLNWYAEVVQTGRLHVHWLWAYANLFGPPSPDLLRSIDEDFSWWLSILLDWSEGADSGKDYPILSGPELLQNPSSLEIIQSDASGFDGFGYVFSSLDSSSYEWYSASWPPGLVPGN